MLIQQVFSVCYRKCNIFIMIYEYTKMQLLTSMYTYIGSIEYLFFWKNLKIKILNIFSNFFFYLKVKSFRLIIKNNFIQIAASAGHAVAYTIGPICIDIIDCVQLYFTNDFMNIVL